MGTLNQSPRKEVEMHREYTVRGGGEPGWYEILVRDSSGPWEIVAKVFGTQRTDAILGFLRSAAA